MAKQRVLAIGLDGYEHSLAEQFMSEGELTHLDSLRARGARFLLNHGAATRTGLAWEHASTGLSPEAAGRAAAVDFDTQTYEVWHVGTSLTPFPASLDSATVVFDPPYFDLGKAPSVRGVVNWGAHDPGVSRGSRPYGVVDDLLGRFGEYPARGTMYDVVWDSPERTQLFSDALVQAAKVRSAAAHWLLAERCPDWDLALVVAGETHSATENLWHGVDRDHPLHGMPSADAAGKGLRAVYRATDDLVGDLVAAFPDARVVAFSMNGMGPNHSDVASMILLPELLFRKDAGRPLLRVPARWSRAADGMPLPEKGITWSQSVMTKVKQFPEPLDSARRIAARALPERVKHLLRPSPPRAVPSPEGVLRMPLDWMPAALYRRHWPSLRYFALPSFYDGRIRINLAGRESQGRVVAADYESVCDEVEALVRECRDSRTGEPVVQQVVHCGRPNPMALGPTDCDLVIVWRSAALGFDHPELGRVGPLPYRRTGGHTGPHGMAYLAGDGLPRGDFGVREAFDVVPTLFSLLGEPVPHDLSGRPLI